MASRSKFWSRLKGDFTSAGDLYYREGEITKAAEMYSKAGNILQAAEVCGEAGMIDEAVAYFLEAGENRKAGELLATAKRPREALPLLEKAGAWWKAAEVASALGDHGRAGRLFKRANRMEEAADAFERSGDLDAALVLWKKESERLSRDTNSGADALERRRKIDERRALAMAQVGRVEDAAEILRGVGMHEQVGALLERLGRYDEAATAYLEANLNQRARRALERAGGLDKRTQAEIYQRAGEYKRAALLWRDIGELGDAAEAFEAAGEWQEAAITWEQDEDPARAAELFYRAGYRADAARCYARANDHRLAAETFADVGDHQSAARSYQQVGRHLRAAQHFLKAGDRPAAAETLQEISPDDPSFEHATLLLVPLLLEERLFEGALHRLKMLSKDASTSTFAVERLYWEGRIHDAQGDLLAAEQSYQRAAGLRREHRDLTARLISLRQRMKRAGIEPGSRPQHGVIPGVLDSGTVLLDRYEVLEEIGRGGMGRVYRARDRQLNADIAVKTLIPRQSDKLNSPARMRREVQICRKISHRHVVRVFDIHDFAGWQFVTMELLDGTTLDHEIQSGRRIELDRARAMFIEILSGLTAAHALKVIHRDLKPANIALTSSGAKIMDFGIAHLEDADVSLTQTGQVVGSPMYMSPEQIQGLPLDVRTDLYSFGVLAFTTLAGREPFTGKTATQISLKHLQEPVPSVLAHRPEADPAWDAFLQQLLAKKPEQRYPNAHAVLEAIQVLLV